MHKRVLCILLFTFLAAVCFSQDYTVVLKNGKTMKGKLISETSDGIVFKDESGVQYSLKKSSLDMEKMQQANIEKPVAPSEMKEQDITESPNAVKKGKVYTKEDVERLKTKYGELTTGEPNAPEQLSADDYYAQIVEGAGRIPHVVESLINLGHQVANTWEASEGAGKNASEPLRALTSSDDYKNALAQANKEISSLNAMKDRLSIPPKAYRDAYENFSTTIQSTEELFMAVQRRGDFTPSTFRSNFTSMATKINEQAQQLQNLEKVDVAPPKNNTPPPPSTESQPSQESTSPGETLL